MFRGRVRHVHFIGVGTPQKKGEYAADLRFVDAVIDTLARNSEPSLRSRQSSSSSLPSAAARSRSACGLPAATASGG